MAGAIYVTSWAVCIYCLYDAIRHSDGEWVHADRSKSSWIGYLVLSGFLCVPTIVIVPAYLLGVKPKFSGADRHMVDNPFTKRPS